MKNKVITDNFVLFEEFSNFFENVVEPLNNCPNNLYTNGVRFK